MPRLFATYGTWVRVSIDGWDDASYAKARKIKDGSFTPLLQNIRNFVDTGTKCTLGVSFIVGEANAEHIYEACEKFKTAGAHHIKISGAVVSNDVAENNIYHRQIKDTVEAQIAKSKALDDAHFQIVNHYHELEDRFEKEYSTCPFLQYLTVIGADCGVYTCQDKAFTQSGMLGSIKEKSFKEFWFSEENENALYALSPSVSCRHHCVAHTKNLSLHDILSVDPDHGCFV